MKQEEIEYMKTYVLWAFDVGCAFGLLIATLFPLAICLAIVM